MVRIFCTFVTVCMVLVDSVFVITPLNGGNERVSKMFVGG